MTEFWFKRNKWLTISIIVFITFLTGVVVLEIIYIPLWVALGTIAAVTGKRFTNKFINNQSPIIMNFFSQFSYDSGIESTGTVDGANIENERKRQQQPPDELIPELEQYTNILMKKYISSWYVNLSNNDQFPNEIEYAFEDSIVALVSRIRHLNSKVFTTKVVSLYHKYFQSFVRASHQSKLLNCEVENVFEERHYALTSEKSEEEHLFNLVNVLIEVLVPADILCCPIGRRLVVSLLVYQVLLPCINLIADPYNFFRILTALLGCDLASDSGDLESFSIQEPNESVVKEDQTCSFGNQSSFERNFSACCSSGEIKIDKPKEIWQRLADDLPSSLKPACQKEIILSNENKSDKISTSNSLDRISDLFTSGLSFGGISNYFRFSETIDRNNDTTNIPKKEEECDLRLRNDKSPGAASEETTKNNFLITSGLEELLNVTAGPVLSDTLKCARHCKDELETSKLKVDGHCGQQNNEEVLSQTILTNSKDISCSDNQLHFHGNPFIKLQIPTTEVVEVTGIGNHYAVYCIQYEAWYPDSTSIKTEEIGSYVDIFEPKHVLQTIIVKRRFREFVTLHSRLEDEQKQNSFLKSIKGPNKWSIIPFSKLDKETIATRRLFLENYLQTLISNYEISSCKCFREFLAYGGDVEAAFVRKPIDLGQFVPRIDKILVKKMTGVLDKLKTALPSLPSESFSSNNSSLQSPSPVEATIKASDRFLGYFNLSSSGSQDSNPSLSFDFGTEEDTSISLESRISRYLINYDDDNMDNVDLAFDAYEMEQWIKDPWSPISTSSPISQLQNKIFISQEISAETQNDDVDLSGAVINLFVEIFTNNSIFNKDNFVNTLKLLFGNTIDGYLIKILNCYMSEEAFAKYLPIIRSHLWSENSGAEISFKDSHHYSQIAQQAIFNVIPGILKVVVGKDHIEDRVKIFLNSFKSPKLSRHLVYSLLDLLVDDLLVKSRSQSILDKLGSLTSM